MYACGVEMGWGMDSYVIVKCSVPADQTHRSSPAVSVRIVTTGRGFGGRSLSGKEQIATCGPSLWETSSGKGKIIQGLYLMLKWV